MPATFPQSIISELRFLRHDRWNPSLVTWIPLLALFTALAWLRLARSRNHNAQPQET